MESGRGSNIRGPNKLYANAYNAQNTAQWSTEIHIRFDLENTTEKRKQNK